MSQKLKYNAFDQLIKAMSESDYFPKENNYIVVARNASKDYTYSYSFDGCVSWSNYCFDYECDYAYENALKHKGECYIVVLAKIDNKQLTILKRYDIIK